MASEKRTLNKGRLVEWRGVISKAKFRINGIVRNIIYHFEPLDNAYDYIDNINIDELETFVEDLKKQLVILKKAQSEAEALKSELGVDTEE